VKDEYDEDEEDEDIEMKDEEEEIIKVNSAKSRATRMAARSGNDVSMPSANEVKNEDESS